MPPHRFELITVSEDRRAEDFADDVRAGLTSSPKRLSCRHFYDAEGSQLFEAICELPEYYCTRTEVAILRRHAPEIAGLFPGEVSLFELGSGSAQKARILLDALTGARWGGREQDRAVRYIAVDISPAALEECCTALADDYPELHVAGIAGEYHDSFRRLHAEGARPTLILWLGSNVGNLQRDEAARFLGRLREAMTPEDRMLVGIDLRKDRGVLERAYDDAAGVTARFNKNILARINRELGGHFDLGAFDHRAVYHEARGRVELYLVSRCSQCVPIDGLDLTVAFDAGEAVHTENSHKYSLEEIEALASAAGLCVQRQWFDEDRLFSVNLFAIQE